MRAAVSTTEDEMPRFLDHAVHDLRAALRKVGTLVEILSEAHPEDPTCSDILEGVSKGGAILEGMSRYSTALWASGYTHTRLKLENALHAALRGLDAEIQASGAQIRHAGLPEVVGDKDRLTDLFRILLSNALTYRGTDAPKVDVGARAEADVWVVSVRDNGIGVASRYQERLFEPFYRLHGAEIPGVGLGLAVGRKILEAHRGRIWVESEPGVGSTFLFALPRNSSENGA